MVRLSLATRLPLKVALTFCIPTRNEWRFLLPHVLTGIWYHLFWIVFIFDDIWRGASFHVLICYFISFVIYLLRSLAHFLTWLFVLHIVEFSYSIVCFRCKSFSRYTFCKYFSLETGISRFLALNILFHNRPFIDLLFPLVYNSLQLGQCLHIWVPLVSAYSLAHVRHIV